MRRREVLASMAAASAGCADLGSRDVASNDAGAVAPFEPADPPDGAGCPDGTTCWGSDGSDGAPAIVPERTTVGPETPTRFALANPTDEDLSFGPYAWRLLKRSGEAWVDVLPRLIKSLGMELPPGDSYAWTVDLAPTYVLGAPDTSGWDERASVDGIGGGTYAFAVSVSNSGERYATAFEFDAPPLSLRVSDRVSSVSVDGDVVTAEIDGDGSYRGSVTVTTEADSATPDPHTVESLLRYPALHDALALLRDRDVSTATVTGAIGTPLTVDTPDAVTFRGTTYGVDVERRE